MFSYIEFAFGRLGVMTNQASLLAQVGRGVLIGQSVFRLLSFALEATNSLCAWSDR